MANYSNNLGQIRLGWRTAVSTTPVNTNDVDATSFITAAGITDTTQISALNTLVNDLKTYGLWTKMKAVYPFVGGSATSHKWNLKDPRDLDAAYRLVFNGGWIHSSNGAKPNGTTGYANTKLAPNAMSQNSIHASFYSRTDISGNYWDLGSFNAGGGVVIGPRYQSGASFVYMNVKSNDNMTDNNPTIGLYMGNRTSSTTNTLFRNGVIIVNGTKTSFAPISLNIYLGAANDWTISSVAPINCSPREQAFASIGDGLTDTEAANFYITVQKFQTTLGRHVGTPYVSDPDAIAFLMAAGITDGTQAAAINTLVIRMKADGVWTKMRAIYPFVGGSSTSHKFNLKDPRDLDAAYRLVFNGGGTHTSNGYKGNGSNSYADSKFPANILSPGNAHLSFYNRTTVLGSGYVSAIQDNASWDTNKTVSLGVGNNGNGGVIGGYFAGAGVNSTTIKTTAWTSLTLVTTTSTNLRKVYNSGIVQGSSTTNSTNTFSTSNLVIGAHAGAFNYVGSYETSFVSFGDGLTDTDATNLYSAVQSYQTTLGRQTDVPLVSDTDAQSFLNAANITSFQQASAVNKLVVDLKAAGVWSKMKAIYPFVGGSATSHKWNLKDPRDLDAAYRLSFNGGWVHSSTGALPNGTTGYADTKFSEFAQITINDTQLSNYTHLSLYSRTNAASLTTYGSIGVDNAYNGWGSLCMTIKRADGLSYGYSRKNIFTPPVTMSDSRGFFMINRQSNTTLKYTKDNSLIAQDTTGWSIYGQPGATRNNVWLGAMFSDYGTHWYDNKEHAFASIGYGLTDAEATSLYNAVQTYQTSLGRSVNTPVYNNGLVLNLDAGNANSYPGTGTTWFDLAAGNNGTLVNGPTYDTTNGGSLYFDGTNKYTDISYTKINITNKLTISSWVYFLSQPSTTGNPNIVDKWDWPNNKRSFHIGTENGYLATSISYDGLFDNRIVCSDNSSIVLNQWINITMTYDGRTLKLYKNGSLIQSSSFSQDRNIFSDITTNIFLGRSRGTEGSSRHLNVRISGVQIYSNSLTATEILNNFNSTRGRFGI